MTEKETIDRLNKFKSIKVLYGNTFAMTTEQLKILQEDIETAINILKEKDKKIEELKQTLSTNIVNNFTSSMKEKTKSKEDLKMLDKGWQIELEKKDKIIDLMAEQIKIPEPTMKIESFDIKPKTKFGMRYLNKEEVKQYFERKSEK